LPSTVSVPPDAAGWLKALRFVTLGASNENDLSSDPTDRATERYRFRLPPDTLPEAARQETAESEVQTVDAQRVSEIAAVAVASTAPKLTPDSETMAPPESGMLSAAAEVTTGALYENTPPVAEVPTTDPTVRPTNIPLPRPNRERHATEL